MNQSTKHLQTFDAKGLRAITKGRAIAKSSILLSQYWNLSNKPLYGYRGACPPAKKTSILQTIFNIVAPCFDIMSLKDEHPCEIKKTVFENH